MWKPHTNNLALRNLLLNPYVHHKISRVWDDDLAAPGRYIKALPISYRAFASFSVIKYMNEMMSSEADDGRFCSVYVYINILLYNYFIQEF